LTKVEIKGRFDKEIPRKSTHIKTTQKSKTETSIKTRKSQKIDNRTNSKLTTRERPSKRENDKKVEFTPRSDSKEISEIRKFKKGVNNPTDSSAERSGIGARKKKIISVIPGKRG